MAEVELDQTDHRILELLTENARRTMGDIGAQVDLSPSAVKRRIDRLESIGVITGYTVVLDHKKTGRPIQAFTEVRFAGSVNMEEIVATASTMPEIEAVLSTAGDPDALVSVRVSDVGQLGHVIGQLRRSGQVTGTKTLIVLDAWTRHGEGSRRLAPRKR